MEFCKETTMREIWENRDNKIFIAEKVYQRLYERYIKPHDFGCGEYTKNYKNGFAMMTCACLLIETLCAFRKGTKKQLEKVQRSFLIFLKMKEGIYRYLIINFIFIRMCVVEFYTKEKLTMDGKL